MSGKNGLTSIQQDVLTKIVNYGDNHGMSSEKIAIAVKAACIESTLGTRMKNDNPKSTASGLFGYTNPNWHDHHRELGDKNNNDNQIIAFYSDIDRYYEWYKTLSDREKNGLNNIGEYVYIKHHDGIKKKDFEHAEGKWLWDSSPNAQLYNPAWIDEARSHDFTFPELPDQLLNRVDPQTIVGVIESGLASELGMAAIAVNLADLSLFSTDRQMLIDAWICLLENAGKDKLAQIDTVSQSENRIQLGFQNGDIASLTSHTSGSEVNQLNAHGDFNSNWWKADGSYGTTTCGANDSVSSTNYDADGNYTSNTDNAQGGITRNSYAADGSYSTYTEDALGNITMNNAAPDGSFRTYTNDAQGNIAINNSASDGSFSAITDDGLGNISNTSYAADGSFSSYTDDGQGNIVLNDYAPDGNPVNVNDAGVIADDNSGYSPDSNYAQDNSANQASNNDTSLNA
ncbi:MAG TPA: hypothetical protein VFN66_10835 [Burkholderiales bacterium]|nr:hypothetical protein [Burkholderiales bacterium]